MIVHAREVANPDFLGTTVGGSKYQWIYDIMREVLNEYGVDSGRYWSIPGSVDWSWDDASRAVRSMREKAKKIGDTGRIFRVYQTHSKGLVFCWESCEHLRAH